jgi:hypothetical protein
MANLRVDKITSTETFEKTGSVQFDGTGDYLYVSGTNQDFAYGTGDFTVEFWINTSNWNIVPFDTRPSGTNGDYFTLYIDVDGALTWYEGGAIKIQGSDGAIVQNTWVHIAAARKGTSAKLFVNGVQTGPTFTDSTDYLTTANRPFIGAQSRGGGSSAVNGYLSNFRVIKGTALYTENFKPPMRELEVTPETVLLACQSKTDASLEKTGKTITVTGNAVANELTPGILTPIVKSGGGSAITGSVEFSGTGDFLQIVRGSNTDFEFGTQDFTIEFFAHFAKTGMRIMSTGDNGNYTTGGWVFETNNKFGALNSDDVNTPLYYGEFTYPTNSWAHISVVRNGSNIYGFVNGIQQWSNTITANILFSGTNDFSLGTGRSGTSGFGAYNLSSSFMIKGFISNLRVIKGTALYTSDFIPPTRELKKVPGTVLLCCQDENSVTTEITGKTITSNGDPAPSNFTPQVGDDRKVTFEGVTKIDTDAYFYLPTGDTASRETTGTYNAGTRGIFGGGFVGPSSGSQRDTIQYINIATTGNAIDAGDLTQARYGNAALASDTRAVWAGGINPSPSYFNTIDAVEIMSTGNAFDFGDLYANVYYPGGVSNRTRGICAGGYQAPSPAGFKNNIGYITIASKGDTQDFGDLITAKNSYSTFGSPTRGCFAGGASPSKLNTIEYVTIATTGNGQDFGDLTATRNYGGGCGSAIRGLVGGGSTPTTVNTIDYVTISAMGSAADFGDLTSARQEIGSCSSATRGVFAGAWSPSKVNTIDFVSIQTTGNGKDFGDLVNIGVMQECGTSNGHGGLG